MLEEMELFTKFYLPILNFISTRNCVALNQILESESIDLNRQFPSGTTLLHEAVSNRASDLLIIKILLKYGANVNIRNVLDQTPIHSMINLPNNKNRENPIIFKTLLMHGAEPNAIDGTHRRTPLESALINQHLEYFEYLLQYNGNMDQQNEMQDNKRSLLHQNCLTDYTKLNLYQLLDISHINPELKNQNNETPLESAISSRFIPLIKVLLEYQVEFKFKQIEIFDFLKYIEINRRSHESNLIAFIFYHIVKRNGNQSIWDLLKRPDIFRYREYILELREMTTSFICKSELNHEKSITYIEFLRIDVNNETIFQVMSKRMILTNSIANSDEIYRKFPHFFMVIKTKIFALENRILDFNDMHEDVINPASSYFIPLLNTIEFSHMTGKCILMLLSNTGNL